MKQISINLQNHKKQVFCSFFFWQKKAKEIRCPWSKPSGFLHTTLVLSGSNEMLQKVPAILCWFLKSLGNYVEVWKVYKSWAIAQWYTACLVYKRACFWTPAPEKNETRNRLNQLWGKAFTIAQWWRTLTLSSSRESRFESQLRTAYNFLYLQF